MNAALLEAAKALPLPERIELAEALWEDISKAGYEPPLTPAQEAEIDRRVEEHKKNPHSATPGSKLRQSWSKSTGARNELAHPLPATCIAGVGRGYWLV